jgi:hypothetical protein
LIHETEEHYAQAGWAAVRAAWACDDENSDLTARTCREKALALFEKASRTRQPFARSPNVGTAIRLDLLRRSGQMESAIEIARLGVPTIPGDDPEEHQMLKMVVEFEGALAERGDRGCHTLDDAFRSSSGEGGRLGSE